MKRFNLLIVILLVWYLPTSQFLVLSQDISALMREGDAFWEKRQDVENAKAAISAYKKVLEQDTADYEACWKIARAYFYLGDRLPENKEMRNRHKELGAIGMQYAEKALELNPLGVEGHYYYTLCLAQYSIGISIIKALAKGLGSKYEKHIGKAIEINKQYDSAGPLRALGRYWYRLPWPKRNLKKSIHHLKAAVDAAPTIIRGHVYLAESYFKAGEKELAREHLHKALEVPPHLTTEVDAMRWKARAEELLR
jgi:tetratricopeptide (TPR) repeat protein